MTSPIIIISQRVFLVHVSVSYHVWNLGYYGHLLTPPVYNTILEQRYTLEGIRQEIFKARKLCGSILIGKFLYLETFIFVVQTKVTFDILISPINMSNKLTFKLNLSLREIFVVFVLYPRNTVSEKLSESTFINLLRGDFSYVSFSSSFFDAY